MPPSRKMLAADSEKAELLSRIASRRGSTLYSYTNNLIEAALLIDKSGYENPKEAASDIVVVTSMMATGFRLCAPDRIEDTQWENLGETLGHLIKGRLGNTEPLRILYSIFSLIIGKNHVFFQETDNGIALIVAVPVDSQLSLNAAKRFAEGVLKVIADARPPRIEQKANLIIIPRPS